MLNCEEAGDGGHSGLGFAVGPAVADLARLVVGPENTHTLRSASFLVPLAELASDGDGVLPTDGGTHDGRREAPISPEPTNGPGVLPQLRRNLLIPLRALAGRGVLREVDGGYAGVQAVLGVFQLRACCLVSAALLRVGMGHDVGPGCGEPFPSFLLPGCGY